MATTKLNAAKELGALLMDCYDEAMRKNEGSPTTARERLGNALHTLIGQDPEVGELVADYTQGARPATAQRTADGEEIQTGRILFGSIDGYASIRHAKDQKGARTIDIVSAQMLDIRPVTTRSIRITLVP